MGCSDCLCHWRTRFVYHRLSFLGRSRCTGLHARNFVCENNSALPAPQADIQLKLSQALSVSAVTAREELPVSNANKPTIVSAGRQSMSTRPANASRRTQTHHKTALSIDVLAKSAIGHVTSPDGKPLNAGRESATRYEGQRLLAHRSPGSLLHALCSSSMVWRSSTIC
jgi:hypothetical protein